MQTGTIVHRRAGHFPPNAFWEAVFAANPHGWGATVFKDGGLMISTSDEGMDLNFLQDTLKEFEDCNMTFYFASSDAAISKVDLSPHILVVKKDEDDAEVPQIVAFIEGNFPTYAKVGSSHPAEYHMAMEYLGPKLESVYDMCEGDLDKVFVQLEKPFFKKELLLTSVSRGHITLVLANGKALTYSQSDGLATEYDWGWTSNNHGYAVGGKKQEAASTKKPSMFSGKSTVREKANPQPSATIAEAVKSPETGGAVIKNITIKRDKPGGQLSRKDRKVWYQARIGYAPPGWEQCVAINVYYSPENKLLTFAQVKAMGLEAASLPPLNNPQRGKDTETDNIEHDEKAPATNGGVTSEVLPIMNPETRKHMKAFMERPEVKKIIAENADMIEDPAKVAALEAKYADFARQLGYKSIDDFLMLDYEQFFDIAKSRPDGIAVMAWSFRNIIAYHRTKKIEKVEEVVADTPPVKTKRPSMFAQAS